MAFRLFVESSQGRRRGRRPRPPRIDDYAAHFHHHPWHDAQLALTPRLRKRLGDGVGGTELGIGDASSPQECARMVRQMQPEANGATYSNTGGTLCYAEFGMTGTSTNAAWRPRIQPSWMWKPFGEK